jgi:hypothetical protein
MLAGVVFTSTGGAAGVASFPSGPSGAARSGRRPPKSYSTAPSHARPPSSATRNGAPPLARHVGEQRGGGELRPVEARQRRAGAFHALVVAVALVRGQPRAPGSLAARLHCASSSGSATQSSGASVRRFTAGSRRIGLDHAISPSTWTTRA